MAKIQIKNSFITSSAQITISSSLVRFSDQIRAKGITGSFSGSIPALSSYFKQGGNSFGTTATLGTNDNQALIFETNGSTRMYISGSGNVGIGTTSPTQKLEVIGAGLFGSHGAGTYSLAISNNDQTNARIRITNSGAGGRSFSIVSGNPGLSNAGFAIYDETSAATRMYISGSGNVGIGTTSPAYKLDVTGDVYSSNYYSVLTAASYGPSDASATMQVFGSVGSAGLTNTIKFVTGGSERVRITSGGYVGIGTATTTSGLQIQTEGTNTTSGSFLFVNSIGASFGGGAIGVGYQYAAPVGNNFYPFRIRAGSTNAIFTINSVGVVYAGDTTGAIPYGNHDPYYSFNQDTNTGMDWAAADTIAFKTGGSERVRIDSTGNVGIGQSSPASKLHVVGSSFITGSANTSNVKFEGGGGNGLAFGTIDATSTYASWIQSGYVSNFGTATYNLLLQPLGGNVGIGTTSPTYKLNVVTTAVSGRQTLTNIDKTAQNLITFTNPQYSVLSSMGLMLRVYPQSDSRQGAGILASGGAFNGDTDLDLFVSSGSLASTTFSALKINARGSVGIGTTSPANNLVVYNASGWAGTDLNGTSGGELIFRTSGTLKANIYASTSTGFVLNGASETIFQIGSSEKMRITSTGYVGIGTTSPSYKLHVNGTAYATTLTDGSVSINNGDLLFAADGGGNGFQFDYYSGQMYIGNNAGSTWYMVIKDNGNVGIGTTSPGSKFEMYGGDMALKMTGVTTGSIQFKNSSNTKIQEIRYDDSDGSMTLGSVIGPYPVKFISSNTERLRIASGGNVGIGTTSPAAKLHVSGTYPHIILNNPTAGSGATILFQDNGTAAGFIGHQNATNKLQFSSTNASVAHMTIDSNGNVGIGTTSIGHLLSIYGTPVLDGALNVVQKISSNASYLTAPTSGIGFGANWDSGGNNAVLSGIAGGKENTNNSDFAGVLIFYTRPNGGNHTERMRITSDGNVGIGTTSPAAKLHVNGSTTIVGDTATTQNVRQTIVGSTTGNASTTAKKIFVCGHTSTGTINVTAFITSVSTASATATFSFANAYGNSVTPNRLSYVSLNSTITSIDCSYNNTGYQMEIAVTYTGATAPTLYFTAEGMGSSIWTL